MAARTSGAAAGQKQIVRDDLICSLCPESATSCLRAEKNRAGVREEKKKKVCRSPEIERLRPSVLDHGGILKGFMVHRCIILNSDVDL